MQNNLKRYAIIIRGKVQNVGYWGIIEGTARKMELIESIERKEIRESLPLPHQFSRIATDEYYESSRKFDIGLDYLDGIKTDTSDMKGTLWEMKGSLVDVKGSLNSIDNTLGAFVTEQREHNQHLEKILEKLAEK